MQQNPDLTDDQKRVLFDKATEAPFSGELLDVKDNGDFRCANCHSVLFHSDRKYDSGSGWPSFDDEIEGAVDLFEDDSHGMVRTEIACSNCGAHLGHIFNDGPRDTTGMRYCVNSLSLDFVKNDEQ